MNQTNHATAAQTAATAPAPVAVAAALFQGMVALVSVGVAPALLGALADQHRLAAADIGVAAMLELFAMGIAAAVSGSLLTRAPLRVAAAVAGLVLAATELASVGAVGSVLLVLRGLSGIPEGVMLAVSIAVIARAETPERLAGMFFTGMVALQLLMALGFAVWIVPRFGADGGFAALALTALLALPAAIIAPRRLAPGIVDAAPGGLPPRRGLIALAATVLLTAGAGAVGIYLQPLAQQAGLPAGVARTALWASLAAQVLAGFAVTAVAGRIAYIWVFTAVTVVLLGVWLTFDLAPPAPVFIAAAVVGAIAAFAAGPFLAPMTIEADPSRRAALQSGGAQVLGGALGPLLASRVVTGRDVHGVLWLGAAMLVTGFAIVARLHQTHPPTDPQPGATQQPKTDMATAS